uniref:Uncharacterized protein n=1 Tax=Arundo donax TaxID=35708 RepID=A0A0A8ZTE3_ARUDO
MKLQDELFGLRFFSRQNSGGSLPVGRVHKYHNMITILILANVCWTP